MHISTVALVSPAKKMKALCNRNSYLYLLKVIVQQPQPYVVQSSMVTSPAPPAYVTTSKSHSSAVINMAPLQKVNDALK